jgi:hypothetical protein
MTPKKSESNIKVLVKFKCDWADEANIEGFALFEIREWEYMIKEMEAIEYPTEWWWGTNESVVFESSDDIANCCDVSVLNSDQVNFLEDKFIRYGEYGKVPFGSLQGNAPESFYEENGILDDYMKKG